MAGLRSALSRWLSRIGFYQKLGLGIGRIGLDQSTIEYLGVSIPVIDMPVAPGRNIATLVEVAARIQLLRQRGYRPSIQNNEIRMTDGE